jgi:phosphate transport system substrate-binding protein
MNRRRSILRRPLAVILAVNLAAIAVGAAPVQPAAAAPSYQRISGEGSSWAAGAIDAMRVNVRQFGITVDYTPSGSSAGRQNFLNGTVDFAASDIPFQFHPEDGSAPENPAPGSYAYIPVTAGGTSFIYNLKINGQRVTNLRLSGENVAKIFTGVITTWNDPAIQRDNPGLRMPARRIVPVVRSEGSGSTAQFTLWMIKQHGGIWRSYCERSGRAPACGETSQYPTVPGMIAQSGDLGVTAYVTQGFAEGAIGYVNYSYAIGSQFPVAKVLNRAGFYTEPTPENVAVSLLKARINTTQGPNYLTQNLDGVYADNDRRNYPLSSYSYFILPTRVQGQFNTAKGRTLGAFTYYAMCQAQQQSASLGYSPLPVNLVQASFTQIRRIPGVEIQRVNVQECNNPTFSPDGTNLLAQNAPFPPDCDRAGPTQCSTGSGGLADTPTPVDPAAAGGGDGGGGNGGGGTGGGGNGGGGNGGGGNGGTGANTTCDPETGVCDTGGGSSELAIATPTVLAGSHGWSSAQTLMLLVSLFFLALIFVPAFLWRRLANEGGERP